MLLERHGGEGYGAYWLIVEDIAAAMDAGKMSPEAIHTEQKWAQICHVSTRTLRNLLQTMSKHLAKVEQTTDNRIRIAVPNILKYKDEYSKKSGQYQEQSRVEQIQSRVEQTLSAVAEHVRPPVASTSTGTDLVPEDGIFALTALPLNGKRKSAPVQLGPDPFEVWFEEVFWPLYPRRIVKAASKAAARKKMQTESSRTLAMRRLKNELPELLSRPVDKRPYASTWFNQDRYADPVERDPEQRIANGGPSYDYPE